MAPTLYHGSPFRLVELEPRVPRGETPFLIANKLDAQLYALARDPERKNKGWSIRDGTLFLRRNLWLGSEAKYRLNPTGYLHVFEGLRAAQQNPDVPSEWISLVPVVPTRVEEVCLCDLPSQSIQYVDSLSGGFRTLRCGKRYQKTQKLKRRRRTARSNKSHGKFS